MPGVDSAIPSMPNPFVAPDDLRAWVEIDLGALVRNARALAAHARVPLVPMVKADAYGLGAVPVVRALEALDPFAYGVSSIPEAAELRAAGITRPIILYTPVVVRPLGAREPHPDARALVQHRITPTLARPEDITAWAELGAGTPYHLAVDTGMHRAGIPWTHIETIVPAVAAHPPEGVFTHFHSSEADDGSLEAQEARFGQVVARLPVRPRLVYVDNSGGIVRRAPSGWDLVRPGVFLYGVGSWQMAVGGAMREADVVREEGARTGRLRPEPVASLRARILELRDVMPGEGVSYNHTWRAVRPARIATVACGYADGLRRQLGNRAHGLVRGLPAPIRGVVTMDMAMVDVTGIHCDLGDVVTFLGRDGEALLTAEAVAEAGGLSPYELLVGLKLRLPRLYHGA